MLESLLDQKLNITSTYVQRKYHYHQKKNPQAKLNFGPGFQGSPLAPNRMQYPEPPREDEIRYGQQLPAPVPEESEGENLDSQMLTESIVTERGAHKGGGDIETKMRQKNDVGKEDPTKGKNFAVGVLPPRATEESQDQIELTQIVIMDKDVSQYK